MDDGGGFLIVILLVCCAPVVALIAWCERHDYQPGYLHDAHIAETMRQEEQQPAPPLPAKDAWSDY